LSLSANTTNVKSRIRTIQQSLSLSGSFVQDALSSVIKTISEELSFSDGAYMQAKGKLKTIAQSLGLSSTTQRSRPFIMRFMSDNLSISHTTSRMRLFIMRSFSQNLTLSSTAIKSIKSAIKRFIIKIKRFKKLRYN
ncbi:MAG: hypothetical protein ACHQ1D_06850, partial [Nitrososphaerales archaeon]|jgi:hypothetical protein